MSKKKINDRETERRGFIGRITSVNWFNNKLLEQADGELGGRTNW